jgi:chorismate dehydratase
MARLRVSAISYLNTAPLMWDFENPPQRDELKREFDVSYTSPSLCANALRDGSADIGIIPVAAYASIPGLLVIPNVAIAANGPVRSILLASKKPLDEIRSVALDSSSRTSAALVRILFEFFYGRKPSFREAAPNLDKMLAEHDSALLIGDSALQVDRSHYHTWDLSEEWKRLTGKPFVFAFWAIRERSASTQKLQFVAQVFQKSRDAGLNQIPSLVQIWASQLRLPAGLIHEYLTQNIHYHLEPEFIEGMKLFFHYGAGSGVLTHNPELLFLK